MVAEGGGSGFDASWEKAMSGGGGGGVGVGRQQLGGTWRTLIGGGGKGKEKEKRGALLAKERGGGGSGRLGGGVGFMSGKKAGMWAAVLIVVLSVLMILNNASLISQHLLRKMEVWEGEPIVRSGGEIRKLVGAGDTVGPRFKGNKNRAPPALNSSSSYVATKRRGTPLLSPHPCAGFRIPAPPADPKRSGPRPCPVCYLPLPMAIAQMPVEQRFVSPVIKHLSYVSDPEVGEPHVEGAPGSPFGGYPSLQDRADSFNVRESMRVHCGFVKGDTPGLGTGFDIDEGDREAMYACKGGVVASAIFGNYDTLQHPVNISREAQDSVCFFMFIDEQTEPSLEEYDNFLSTKQVGLWRIVVVHNLPYEDARRNGKIPKLLLHRLFPNARFSIWVDGKLKLVQDPYRLWERFLLRTNDTFAISQHYKRFDVFVEAEANKAAGKYSNTSIDAQMDFYRKEGLTPYTSAKLPITSDVPEGCVIIREQTPIANLMSCLWFNEVDRFTSRDQLSFGIVRDKLTANLPWQINMFRDCERRNFVEQVYHRDLLEERGLLKPNPVEKVKKDVGVDTPRVKPIVQSQIATKRPKTSSRHRKAVQERHPG